MTQEEQSKRLAEAITTFPSTQPGQRNAGIFQEIIVEYPSISAYPEYEGKPYFSIKYTENEQEFIGYGTYKPEVLSEYLKEYFIPPTQSELKKGKWIYHIDELFPLESTQECSVCHEHELMTLHNDEFCPNCGAVMRGD